jgi:serine/threonine protein kinase
MMDSRRLFIVALACVVLIAALLPVMYPLLVAFAARCDRRLPRHFSRRIGLAIIAAILAGPFLLNSDLLPLELIGIAQVTTAAFPGERQVSNWSIGLTSALSVWIVIARTGRRGDHGDSAYDSRQSANGRCAITSESTTGRSADQDVSGRGDHVSVHGTGAAGIMIGSGGTSHWDQPTQVSFPEQQSSASHLTYDFEAEKLLGNTLEKTSPEVFFQNLAAADLSSLDQPALAALLAGATGSTAECVKRLIVAKQLTAYQAVLICAGLPSLLRIDQFEVLDRLGRGGMAMVLRARHRVTGHLYALKLLDEHDPIDPVLRNRFLREMEAVCSLAHPSIAVAHSAGQQGQRMHIAMELVEGQNLAELVGTRGPLPLERALNYAAQAARALAHAHSRGLIHRDVKPANLMLGGDDQIKLVDMGLARFIDAIESTAANGEDGWHTHTGHLIGTIDYMAPEQAEELAVSDQRSDIYSLGCTLFFLLTGQSHLRGRTQRRRAMALVSRRGITELRTLRQDLPECLYALISRMTRLNPAARFQSMAEVIAAMDRCSQELGIRSPLERQFRVLMVEDSLTQSIVMRQKLMTASPHVSIEAVTALSEAMTACRLKRFDIVLLDLNLPDSAGVATVARLRHVDAATPIIVLTSSDDCELGVACINAGADDFLPKQEVEADMLQRHILLAIGRKRQSEARAVSLERISAVAGATALRLPHSGALRSANAGEGQTPDD